MQEQEKNNIWGGILDGVSISEFKKIIKESKDAKSWRGDFGENILHHIALHDSGNLINFKNIRNEDFAILINEVDDFGIDVFDYLAAGNMQYARKDIAVQKNNAKCTRDPMILPKNIVLVSLMHKFPNNKILKSSTGRLLLHCMCMGSGFGMGGQIFGNKVLNEMVKNIDLKKLDKMVNVALDNLLSDLGKYSNQMKEIRESIFVRLIRDKGESVFSEEVIAKSKIFCNLIFDRVEKIEVGDMLKSGWNPDTNLFFLKDVNFVGVFSGLKLNNFPDVESSWELHKLQSMISKKEKKRLEKTL